MFRGSIPTDVQSILASSVKSWGVSEIHVGCSGNFTVERALASIGDYRMHANDVTVYSSVAGAYLARQDFPLTIKNELFTFMEPYIQEPVGKVAAVFLASRMVEAITSTGALRTVAYYKRMFAEYVRQYPELHTKTVAKISALHLTLESYYCGDVAQFVDTCPQDGAFIVYPPFYAGDYTSMFKKLGLVFEWNAPTFAELDDAGLVTLYDKVTSKQNWLIGTDTPQERFAEFQIGLSRTSNRGLPVYIYGSAGPKKLSQPHQKVETVFCERLQLGDALGDDIRIHKLSGGQFAALRSQYMNAFIVPGSESAAYGITVSGKLVGVFAISTAPNPSQLSSPEVIYLLSDFCVAPSSYPKLSKLVLYAAMSHEARQLFERVSRKRVRALFTTAFSKHPESMKYRGIFKLYDRKENPDLVEGDEHYGRRYKLNYKGEAGRWSLAEGLALWKSKHGAMGNAEKSYND